MKKIIVLILLYLVPIILSANTLLFENGKTQFNIRHEKDADSTVLYAVQELKDALEKISGVDFTVTTQQGNPEIAVYVDPEIGDPDMVSITTRNGNLYLSGGSSASVLYSVYSFLQMELGVRWLWPGKEGEFIPVKKSWTLPELDYHYRPAIKYRGFHLCGDWRDVNNFQIWMARNFINAHRHGNLRYNKMGFHFLYSSHNVFLPKSVFAEHPEYFAEIKGKHYSSQVCFNNPEVDRLILASLIQVIEKKQGMEILSIFPSDNNDYCQCSKCAAKGVTTSWFDFYNRLTDSLKTRYPKLKFATIAYQDYLQVPKNPICNSEFVEYATYSRCNVHTFDGKCELNIKLLEEMRKWEATGITMGNYGYEFDIFRDPIFLPFLSIIDDAIKTSVKLKHAAVITEVPLSPKDGPDIQAFAVKNRLPLYLYAQLLWNPQAKMNDLLHDWCKVLYGNATEPMYQYFLSMDRHWMTMKHRTILGSSADAAPDFLSPELQKEVANAFAAADKSLENDKNPHVEQEKLLFNQWMSMLNFKEQVTLPKLKNTSDFQETSFQIPEVEIRAAWSTDALYFREVRPPCEITLSNGMGGEIWNFELNADGKKKSWKQSLVGVKDNNWSPIWSYQNGVIEIPFTSLGNIPTNNDVWKIRVTQKGKVYPASEMASLRFSSASQTDRTILWWVGGPQQEKERHHVRIQSEFEQLGWQLKFVENGGELAQGNPTVYWLRHPDFLNKIPAENWKKIRADIKNGAVAVFVSYMPMPLEEYFNDPSFKVKISGIKNLPLAARRSKYLMPGEWINKPHNLEFHLKNKISPPYGVVPEKPEKWIVMGTMDLDGVQPGKEIPFIMARPYGKGAVFVMGENVIQSAKLLENLYNNRETLLKSNPVSQ